MTRWAVGAGLVLALVSSGTAGGSASAVPAGLIVSVVSAPEKDYRRTRSWLEVSTLAGTDRRRLTSRPGKGQKRQDTDPAVSPDGKTIAFARLTPSGGSLWIIGADGSKPRLLVAPGRIRGLLGRRSSALGDLVWSPDGSKLMAVVDARGHVGGGIDVRFSGCRNSGLIVAAVDSPTVNVVDRLKPRTDATLLAGDWSPDGSSVAYITKYNDGECLTTHEGNNVVSIAAADGRRHRGLVNTGVTYQVSWSADGSRLAYASDCDEGEGCNLFVVNSDGTHRRRLTAFTDPTGVGERAYTDFPFAWWNGRILFARNGALVALDPANRRASNLFDLPCVSAKRRCNRYLWAVSATTAVVDADGLEAASLPDGKITPLPYPHALRRSDSIDYFVVSVR